MAMREPPLPRHFMIEVPVTDDRRRKVVVAVGEAVGYLLKQRRLPGEKGNLDLLMKRVPDDLTLDEVIWALTVLDTPLRYRN